MSREQLPVLYNWGAHHGAISYRYTGDKLIIWAAMLRIPVCMHNVPPERIFRPSAWTTFGTQDPQGADYRACAPFGPRALDKRKVPCP